MAGHVFVTRADLTSLACDAWLLPTDSVLRIEPSWHNAIAGRPLPRPSEAWRNGSVRSVEMPGWDVARRPLPWLTNVGGSSRTEMQWYVEAVREFIDRAARHASSGNRFLTGRSRPLIALPVVGIRHGGAKRRAGEVVKMLLDCLGELVTAPGLPAFDVALVAKSEEAFAAAQSKRREHNAWPELTAEQAASATSLADMALNRRLVLFIGAGVSAGANAPNWEELLSRLAREAGIPAEQMDSLKELDYLDRATLIQQRLLDAPEGSRQNLGKLVAKHVDLGHPSLSHTMLAAMPVREVVTTNYDRLFEQASEGIERSVSVLPHAPLSDGWRWLLKMHGCVTAPQDIVLTRQDYLRYEQHRAALAGIVQALLITHHLLFIGFSLKDDNFHRIIDAVRRALRPEGRTGAGKFGTVTTLNDRPLHREIWKRDLDWVVTASGDDSARTLEIFLDRMLSDATSASRHLLDPDFEAVLSPYESELRGALKVLANQVERLQPDARSPAAADVERMLRELGWTGRASR